MRGVGEEVLRRLAALLAVVLPGEVVHADVDHRRLPDQLLEVPVGPGVREQRVVQRGQQSDVGRAGRADRADRIGHGGVVDGGEAGEAALHHLLEDHVGFIDPLLRPGGTDVVDLHHQGRVPGGVATDPDPGQRGVTGERDRLGLGWRRRGRGRRRRPLDPGWRRQLHGRRRRGRGGSRGAGRRRRGGRDELRHLAHGVDPQEVGAAGRTQKGQPEKSRHNAEPPRPHRSQAVTSPRDFTFGLVPLGRDGPRSVAYRAVPLV